MTDPSAWRRSAKRDGHGAEGDRSVEHVVVEREVAGDRGVLATQAKLGKAVAVLRAEARRGGLEFGLAARALPKRLERLLEFTHSADARVSENDAAREGGRRGRGVCGLGHGSSWRCGARRARHCA